MGFICNGEYQECTFCGARFSADCNPDGHRCKEGEAMSEQIDARDLWQVRFMGTIGHYFVQMGRGPTRGPMKQEEAELIVRCVNAFAGCRSDVPEGAMRELVDAVGKLNTLVKKAQDILGEYLEPHGTRETAIDALLVLLDCSEQRKIQGAVQKALAPFVKE